METFDQISDQYKLMIHKIIRILHIYKNHEDFYQQGLIALWEAYDRYDPNKGYFGRYAFLYIKGRIKDELRREKKHEDQNVHVGNEFWENFQAPVTYHLTEDQLLASLCYSLTEKQKKWFLYTYFDHLTTRETAEKEQVSLSTVKAWKAGVRRKLRITMCGKGESDKF